MEHRKFLGGLSPCCLHLLTTSVTHLRVTSQHLLFHFWEQRPSPFPEELGSPSCSSSGAEQLPRLCWGMGHHFMGHSLLWPLLLPLLALPKFSTEHKCPCARVAYALWGAARPALFPSSPPMVEQLNPLLCFFVSLQSFFDLHRGKSDLLFRYLSANSPW